MAFPFQLPTNFKIHELLNPATDAAGRTGIWVSLKTGHKAWVVCHLQQGNAATVTFTINQAKDVSGTGSKASYAGPLWANEDTSSGGSDTLVVQTAANAYTTGATLKNKIVVFEIDPVSLDVANGFRTITVITGASNVANVTQAIVYVGFDRYQQATPPSIVSN